MNQFYLQTTSISVMLLHHEVITLLWLSNYLVKKPASYCIQK